MTTDDTVRGDEGQAWQELKALLGARIEAGLASEISTKSLQDVLDEELPVGRGGTAEPV